MSLSHAAIELNQGVPAKIASNHLWQVGFVDAGIGKRQDNGNTNIADFA
ncbi:hypothetical protein [Microcoleus sp. FACHB-68]|nr:hypothetical protein [Microcoleus sp. FACHB-68]MBD1939230.1 hypothetical protein [Microcoleus sp. FACHB-68]